MKHTFTILSLLISTLAFGQADYAKYQRLIDDVAVWASNPDVFKFENTSRAAGQFTHNLDSIVSKVGKSFVTDKQIMQYNENGTTHQIHEYGLDSGSVDLKLQSIYTFTYDGIELPNNLLVESRNPDTKNLEESIGITLQYDGQERVDTVVISLPDPLSGDFGPLLGLQYVYDGDHLIQARQWYYVSFLGTWIPGSISDFYYDQDLLVEQVTAVYDFVSMQINPSTRSTYAYNAQDLTDTVNTFTWIEPSWEPTQRFAIDYYGNETMANEYGQVHDGSMFVNSSWTQYPVENVTDQFPVNFYLWDQMALDWGIQDSTNNLLNPALEWSEVAAPRELSVLSVLGQIDVNLGFLGSGSVTDEVHNFAYDTLSNGLLPTGKDYYHYSLRKGSAVSDVLPDFMMVNPNPAQEQFTITLDQNIKARYTVYASNGAEQVSGIAQQGTNHIRTSSWPQGVYYVLITLDDGSSFAHKQMIH